MDSLSSKYAATVLIAKNGSGKTTLIAALDAFLRAQFTRFVGLDFERIVCKFNGLSDELVLTKDDVNQLAEISTSSEISSRAKAWELEPVALLELLETNIAESTNAELIENLTFHQIYTKMSYDFQLARSTCIKLAASLQGGNLKIYELRKVIRTVLKEVEIVYLPTYRRIELSLTEPESRRGGRRKSILSKLGVAKSGLYTFDIQFGLGDISDRLK